MTKEKTLININGEFFDKENAKISVFDRGFLFGDSVYEVTLTYDGIPFLLDEHLRRLVRSAEGIQMPLQWSLEFFKDKIQKGLKYFKSKRLYIRLIVSRGEGVIGLDPSLALKQNFVIIFKELSKNPKEWYEKGVHVIVADIQRNAKKAIDPSVKSGNYLNNVMAMTQAKKENAFDAIMLNHKDQVTEGTTNNIWIVQREKIITPPLKTGLLGGITRAKLIELGRIHSLNIQEDNFTVDTLKNADEAFLSASTKELIPIIKVDSSIIGSGTPGPVTRRLHQHYQTFIHQFIDEHRKNS